MKIKLNNETIELQHNHFSIKELLELKNIRPNGTALAINGKLIKQGQWDSIQLKENDDIIVISAAFGG